MHEAFDIMEPPERPLPFRVLRESDIEERSETPGTKLEDSRRFVDAPAYTEPLKYVPVPRWLDVTEETETSHGHGEHWTAVGRAMHRFFEELSRGQLHLKDITERLKLLLALEGITVGDIVDSVMQDVFNMHRVGLLGELATPAANAFTELPFVLEKDGNVYKGRIDRVIVKQDRADVYDYKTFPISESEIPELIEKYGPQMRIYKEAAERLFGLRTKAYLVFTNMPRVVEV
jgi:ATP-dependent exoDNAse (exonuclease V) beta subunit